MLASLESELPVAFVGTCPPRRCGIATFTRDLTRAMASADAQVRPMLVALTEPDGEYDYADDVGCEIRQAVRGDYARAAEFVNYGGARFVSVQHEYGIFGGDDGSYLLDFMENLRVPAITTLHTVLERPSDSQRAIVQQLAKRSGGLVVMSQVAVDLLAGSYDVSGSKVNLIAHGIPELRPTNQDALKAKFGVAGRRMLLTFGLLSPNKGIETVIRALPALLTKSPDLVYFVVGATHPGVLRRDGEAYRTMLEREAERLGVREHVVFRDQYITNDELSVYLQAADIFVSPYLNVAQVTSGALSYAMGAGAGVVSTPFWHAKELLADGRGELFDFGDSAGLSGILDRLLSSRPALERMRSAAYEFTRPMVWSRVGQAYLKLGVKQLTHAAAPARSKAARTSGLPNLCLDHIELLSGQLLRG